MRIEARRITGKQRERNARIGRFRRDYRFLIVVRATRDTRGEQPPCVVEKLEPPFLLFAPFDRSLPNSWLPELPRSSRV